MKSAKREPKG